MGKIGKDRGLIDYLALTDEANERAGNPKISIWRHIFRLRTIIYTVLWSAIGIGLTVMLFIRTDFDVTVAAVRNPQFVTLSDGTIRNTYDMRIRNMTGDDATFRISLSDPADFEVQLEGRDTTTVEVPVDSTFLQRVYVTASPDSEAADGERTDLRFWIEVEGSDTRLNQDTHFFGRGEE
ncbi:MAG: FixG Ig-like domain-containing protein, partial [Roseicyclus sp.]